MIDSEINLLALNLIRDLEQIEATALQLKLNNIMGARAALFLLDSLVDIITYDYIRYFPYNLRVTPKKLHEILENYRERINFLKNELGILDENTHQFAIEMHRLRGETYHKGKLRGDVLISLVNIYYKIVCKLLGKLWDARDPLEQSNFFILLEHENANNVYEDIINYIKSKSLFEELINSRHISYNTLIEKIINKSILNNDICFKHINKILSNNLINRIESVNKRILFYLNLSLECEINEEHINTFLRWIEFCCECSEKKEYSKLIDIKTIDFGNFQPKINYKKLEKLKKQANDLIYENNYGKALQKWGTIDIEILKCEGLLSNTSVIIDYHIHLKK